jgi:hypothetical protein
LTTYCTQQLLGEKMENGFRFGDIFPHTQKKIVTKFPRFFPSRFLGSIYQTQYKDQLRERKKEKSV